MSEESVNRRKLEHIEIIRSDPATDRERAYFDRIHLAHRGLPEIDLEAVDTATTLFGRSLRFPLLISSMTGGDHEVVRRVNDNLAQAARATGVALGVGSQRVMFRTPEARASFALRDRAPDALLFANLGAVQLNYGFGIEECREAVDAVGADALFLHLNPLQEAVQPEGDTRFAGLIEKIGALHRALDVPVVLKEVGAGLSLPDAEHALRHGIRYLDVAGAGGTSWSRIEARRGDGNDKSLGMAFQDWGIPTPLALRQLQPLSDRLTLFASGGLRSGIDMVKSIILGASLCGLAAPFLQPAMESPEAVIAVIERLHREFQTAMFLLGVDAVDGLRNNERLILDAPW